MKVKSESEVTQSFLTLSEPMDCSLPGSSVHGIFQARVLEWIAIAFSSNTTPRLPPVQFSGDGSDFLHLLTSFKKNFDVGPLLLC